MLVTRHERVTLAAASACPIVASQRAQPAESRKQIFRMGDTYHSKTHRSRKQQTAKGEGKLRLIAVIEEPAGIEPASC
jgi:hypothetical protein